MKLKILPVKPINESLSEVLVGGNMPMPQGSYPMEPPIMGLSHQMQGFILDGVPFFHGIQL